MDLGIENIVLKPEDLFESSSSEEKTTEGNNSEDTKSLEGNSDLPNNLKAEDLFDSDWGDNDTKENNTNMYQGLLNTLVEDGVFDEGDEDVKDADSFKNYIDKQVVQKLDNYQQEIKKALDVGMEPSEIQIYNQAMNWLNQFTDDVLEGTSKECQQARANLIYRDYINKGFSEQKAKTLTQNSIKEGNDTEDAKDALISVEKFFTDRYNQAYAAAEAYEKQRQQAIIKSNEDLKKNILEKDTLFNSVKIDKNIRQKAYDAVTKVVTRTEDGEDITGVQKYAKENPVEFRTVLGLMYAMTDGFRSFDKIFNQAVDKKVNSKLDEFTRKVTSTQNSDMGSISYKNGKVKDLLDSGWVPLI